MRRQPVASGLAVGALTVVLVAGFGHGTARDVPPDPGSSASPISGSSLYADVAARMVSARTAQFVFSGTGGGEIMSGFGAMRFKGGERYDADVQLTMPETGRVRAVLVPAVSYLALPAVKGLPKSRPWLRVPSTPRTSIGKQLGPVVDQLRAAFDPAQCLGLLRSARRVEEIGPALVEGEPTTHYRAEVDLRRAARAATGPVREQYVSMLDAGADSLRYDVWVDSTGLPRRYSAELPSGRQLFSVTGVYRDWGAAVTIDQPSAKQVFDADKLTDLAGRGRKP